jgi:hypothetical protein
VGTWENDTGRLRNYNATLAYCKLPAAYVILSQGPESPSSRFPAHWPPLGDNLPALGIGTKSKRGATKNSLRLSDSAARLL